jgi:hypothetical protein
MNELIEHIARNPVKINTRANVHILFKINDWIDYIFEHGKLFSSGLKDFEISEDKDFTLEMKRASLGTEYYEWKVLPSELHESGESWTFEKLVLCSNTGLVHWYCNYFSYSKTEYEKCIENSEICILGAFYHRMKIVMENIYRVIDFLEGKWYEYCNISSVHKLFAKPSIKESNPNLYNIIERIVKLDKKELIENYLIIETVLDLVQQKIFSISKNKSFS